MEKKNILIFEAHSDDAAIGMGGVIYKYKDKYSFILITMTKGETAYTNINDKEKMAQIRKEESLLSDSLLGIEEHVFLDNPCQDLQNNLSNYHTLVKLIRLYKPVKIFTHKSPSKHRDHRATHDLVTEAWWKASENVVVDLGKPYRVQELYYFEVTDLFEFPDVIIDISDSFMQKQKALKAFKSQIEVLPGIESFVEGLAKVRGYQGGFKYGEAFKKSDFLSSDSLNL
ncbi:MAG: PIG-L deacetylase family protein [Promethearchaeota archaeon]